jgi:starch-binding outer membrane protein, SusD/RagB family
MKRNKIIWVLASLLLVIAGCKKDFLVEKRDLTGVNEDVFKDPLMAQAYVNYIYGLFQPSDNAQAFIQEQNGANGSYNTAYTQTTEELGGQTNWNRVWPTIAINQAHAHEYFGQRMSTSLANNVWTRMKQINLFLDEIDKHGLPEGTRDQLKGQMLFWRAYQYFELLKLYGGVPLILTAQNPIVADGDNSNSVPRSKSSEVLEQIVKDLDAAKAMLPPTWGGSARGRITSGAAAAFKGRVLLTWASPLFNRNDDRARYERAYNANLEAKTLLEQSNYGLYKEGSLANAAAWEKMFYDEDGNSEAVLIYAFNSVQSDQVQRNSGMEQAARSKEILGSGSISPTKQMVDAFPMKDGKMKDDPTSTYTYDAKKFYKNRDPRFYKTFAYNGALWPYRENTNYIQWTYSWFTTAAAATSNKPNKFTETRGPNASGIYLRKGTNPNASNSSGDFQFSGTDYIELRFAEVVLNLAESAIGFDKLSEGLALIKSIRERAGVENGDGSYGLSGVTTRDQHFAAVLNERKIEFAYEGKRFWDLRRWMLFNDDYGTVTRLGTEPLDGMRRQGIWIYVKNVGGTKYVGTKDPLIKNGSDATAPVVERQPATFPAGITSYDQYLDYLYDNHFEVIVKDDLDPTNPADWKFKWYKEYYFFGLHQNILNSSPYLQQTKDWPDVTGQMGTFDPLL